MQNRLRRNYFCLYLCAFLCLVSRLSGNYESNLISTIYKGWCMQLYIRHCHGFDYSPCARPYSSTHLFTFTWAVTLLRLFRQIKNTLKYSSAHHIVVWIHLSPRLIGLLFLHSTTFFPLLLKHSTRSKLVYPCTSSTTVAVLPPRLLTHRFSFT